MSLHQTQYGSVTLDKFDRATAINDPVSATDFTTTYGADGQAATMTQPNGNSTEFVYDRLGRLTSKDATASGPVNRALYDFTYNRSGQILTEASTISGDPDNGTVTYVYDPLARLASSELSSTTTTYGWDKVPNRLSVQVGAGATATTTFNAANRPTGGTDPTASYSSDDDGRLTARPNQTMTWDDLGRLTAIKNAAGTVTLAAYTYDPLDRLRMVDYTGGVRTRFRYVGTTTSAAQLIDDAAGTVTRHVGTGWTGERLLDWTGSGSDIRIYGTNAHHDVTWLAGSTGTVSQSLRYDPWGTPRSSVPSGYSPFRFQGSFHDATTDLSWVVTRWYAPALGTFISEDSLLGEPADPPSRHLYAYGTGDPVGRWDPDGRVALEHDVPLTRKERRNAYHDCTLGNRLLGFDLFDSVDCLYKRLGWSGAVRAWGENFSVREYVESGLNPKHLIALARSAKYTRFNYRAHLANLTGRNPVWAAAHHVFPQKFEVFFARVKGFNIHDPQYLTWWEKGSHGRNAYEYNQAWQRFFATHRNYTKQELLQFGRALMLRYGRSINYRP